MDSQNHIISYQGNKKSPSLECGKKGGKFGKACLLISYKMQVQIIVILYNYIRRNLLKDVIFVELIVILILFPITF